MAVLSVEQNSTIEQLTILASVILPLTFVTGFFGQNFSWLTDHISGGAAFAAYGIGGLVVPLIVLFLWLRLRAPSGKSRRQAIGAAAGQRPRTADRGPAFKGAAE